MKPRAYFDVRVTLAHPDSGNTAGSPRIAGVLFGAIHGAMRNRPGRFAVAFPRGRGFMAVIRVFGSSCEELDELATVLRDSRLVQDYAAVSPARTVPSDYSGPWVQYRRFRIPTRSADRHDGAPCRARRIDAAEERRLPYLMVRSRSTGQQFGLRFECIPASRSAEECEPDGYGLARASQPFAVPDLPA